MTPSFPRLEPLAGSYTLRAMVQDFLFDVGDIRITRAVAQISNTSYQIASIESVRITSKSKAHPVSIAVFVLGLGLLGAAVLGQVREVALTGVAFMVGAGLLRIIWPRREFVLMLKTSSGEMPALRSRKKELVVKVKQALEQAFIARHAQG